MGGEEEEEEEGDKSETSTFCEHHLKLASCSSVFRECSSSESGLLLIDIPEL